MLKKLHSKRELRIWLPNRHLLPMYLNNLTAMSWAIKNMNTPQIEWLSRRNWNINTQYKPQDFHEINDDPWVYEFCICATVNSDQDLMFAQLIFSDCRLETV